MTTSIPTGRLHVADDPYDRCLDDVVALRRCAQYRKGFRWAAVSYPADVVRLDATAAFVRRYGVSVDVHNGDELEAALSASIDPVRVILHQTDSTAGLIRDAVDAGVGRIVVKSVDQVDVLAAALHRRQRVLIEVTAAPDEGLTEEVVACGRLDLIGLHRRLTTGAPGPGAVRSMIAAMYAIARQHGVIPARLSLADIDVADWGCEPIDVRRMSATITDAIEDGCIAGRFPRPAVNLSPSRATLMRPAQRHS